MNATAHQMPSPISPYTQQTKQTYPVHRSCYPSSPAMSPGRQQAPTRGLGLYPCSMPPSHAATVSPLVASPQSEAWSQAPAIEHEYATSQPPDIFSAAIDPFSGWSATSTTGMVGPQSPEAPGLEFCQTPPSSNLQSHRGSVSSYAPSDGSERAYTPRAKPDDAADWYPSVTSEHVLQRASTQTSLPYTPGSAMLPSQTEDLYRTQQSQAEDLYRAQSTEWSKGDTAAYLGELHTSPDTRLPRFDFNMVGSVGRIKKKRQRTTPEEATHDCKVCGKLFKRSYNWKSHMETHNPDRKYPHPCTAMIGDQQCSKKFQRKTDLDRHYDSVHLKARNHKCNLCGNRFARRDTLRRHAEDGCPKRFELGIRDPVAAAAAQQQSSRFSFPPPAATVAYPSRSKSFSGPLPHSSPLPPNSAASAGPFPMYHQPMTLPPPPAFQT